MCGILMGPPNDASPVMRLYEGFGVSCPVSENERASSDELSSTNPRLPLYNDRPPRRLFPNAADCAKGEAAPLFTLPLIRTPSVGACCCWPISAGALSAGVFAPSPDAFTWARWNPLDVFA